MSEPKKVTAKTLENAFEEAVLKDNRCNLGKILDSVDDELRSVIQTKLEDEIHYSAATISRVLKSMDFPIVSDNVVSKHRRGMCRCK